MNIIVINSRYLFIIFLIRKSIIFVKTIKFLHYSQFYYLHFKSIVFSHTINFLYFLQLYIYNSNFATIHQIMKLLI